VIDHIGLGVRDLEQSKAFYQQTLGRLGYLLLMERDGSAGLGRNAKPDFWIHATRPLSGPTHVAIASPDRATVHAFHAAGLEAGGRDNGPAGLRPH
jgi:catechol 2,3-dioxygenase-like lactoylglutathione lyase family enzyme